MEFKYEILKETEKAKFIKVPYWEQTTDDKKKNKQKFFECWIPNVVLADSFKAKNFVINKKEEKRLYNGYQKAFYKMPISTKTLGEYAPEKTQSFYFVRDENKFEQMKKDLCSKYGFKTIDALIINNENIPVSREDEQLAGTYFNTPKFFIDKNEMPFIPKIKIIEYKNQ